MKKNIVIMASIILLLAISFIGCNNEEVNQQELISEYVKNNEVALNKIINKIELLEEIDEKSIINEMPKDIKIIHIYKADNINYIDFSVEEGITSSSHYYGFYYSTLNEPITIMAMVGEKEEFENGYKIQEPDNEDWYYTEKITDNFYFYEAHY